MMFLAFVLLAGLVVLDGAILPNRDKLWAGRWISEDRYANWEAFKEACDLPRFCPKKENIVLSISKEGDLFRYEWVVADTNFKTGRSFQLGQPYEFGQGRSQVSLKATEEDDDLVVTVKVADHPKELSFAFTPKGTEHLVQTYKYGGIVGQRWFKKDRGVSDGL